MSSCHCLTPRGGGGWRRFPILVKISSMTHITRVRPSYCVYLQGLKKGERTRVKNVTKNVENSFFFQVAHKCVSPPPISHGGECLSQAVLFLYLFSCPIFTDRSCQLSTWYFISHFHIFIAQQCFFHGLFRMGESDYLDDNLMTEAILMKRKMIFFLFLLVATTQYLFHDFDWIVSPQECNRLSWSFLTEGIT